MNPDIVFDSFCEIFDRRFEARCVRFLTQGIMLVIRSEIFDSRYDVFDSLCEVYNARFYVFDSFGEIFDFWYDIDTRVRFLTQGIMLVIRSEVFDPRFNVCHSM
jgi:hypothetical protein